jgi:hypothetical protein
MVVSESRHLGRAINISRYYKINYAIRKLNQLSSVFFFFFFGETDIRAGGQEISCILWNTEFHYCVHKSPPRYLILTHMKPVTSERLYFF